MSYSNVMYRVSDSLRTESTVDGWTTVLSVHEQCGCFYYFSSIDNACRAAKEFGTGIDVVPFCNNTTKSDDWYA